MALLFPKQETLQDVDFSHQGRAHQSQQTRIKDSFWILDPQHEMGKVGSESHTSFLLCDSLRQKEEN